MEDKKSDNTTAKISVTLHILRRASAKEEPYWQDILYETDEENATVARALTEINDDGSYVDREGNPVGEIRWQCSCLQKKCGSCAMVIDGLPRLACDEKLIDHEKTVTIEPLRKFPVVADLMVDRSILFENLKQMQLWAGEEFSIADKRRDLSYESSRCLQCGCCLEVCPNFWPGGTFYGAAAFVPTTRLIVSLPKEERRQLKKNYLKHVYSGCGKSLSCEKICPAGIETSQMLIRSNAASFWGR